MKTLNYVILVTFATSQEVYFCHVQRKSGAVSKKTDTKQSSSTKIRYFDFMSSRQVEVDYYYC